MLGGLLGVGCMRDMLMAYELDLHGEELAGRKWVDGSQALRNAALHDTMHRESIQLQWDPT